MSADPLRDYMRHIGEHDHSAASWLIYDALPDEDRQTLNNYLEQMDAQSIVNAGMLAALADAVYGKGGERRGYPRGMVAKVRRVFAALRRAKRDGWVNTDAEARLLSEVPNA